MPSRNRLLISRHTLQGSEQWQLKEEQNYEFVDVGVHLCKVCSRRLEAVEREQLRQQSEGKRLLEEVQPLWRLLAALPYLQAPEPSLPVNWWTVLWVAAHLVPDGTGNRHGYMNLAQLPSMCLEIPCPSCGHYLSLGKSCHVTMVCPPRKLHSWDPHHRERHIIMSIIR